MCGISNNLRQFCTETALSINDLPSIEIIEESKSDFYAKQLSRLCDTQNSV